jgi:cytochrome c oxidase subunit 2
MIMSRKTILGAFGVSVIGAVLYACGGGSSPSADSLSPSAQEGLEIAQNNGCASCHGSDFDGAGGPSWKGLAGSVRKLTNGTEVLADREYLATAIMDPGAQVVRGYSLMMPVNGLSTAEVEKIVDYIEELK